MHQWVISYQWQRCWAEQAIFIYWYWSKQNIASKNEEGRKAWHMCFTRYIGKSSKGIHSLAVNYALFKTNLMIVKNTNNPSSDVLFSDWHVIKHSYMFAYLWT